MVYRYAYIKHYGTIYYLTSELTNITVISIMLILVIAYTPLGKYQYIPRGHPIRPLPCIRAYKGIGWCTRGRYLGRTGAPRYHH